MTVRSWRTLQGLLRTGPAVRCRPPSPVAREACPRARAGLSDDDVPAHLAELHDSYVERVNQAVEEGRDDLVEGLIQDYTDEALSVITRASEGAG